MASGTTANYTFLPTFIPGEPLGYRQQITEIRRRERLLLDISGSGLDQHPQVSGQQPLTSQMGIMQNLLER